MAKIRKFVDLEGSQALCRWNLRDNHLDTPR